MNEDRVKYIRTKSINAITYILYKTMEDLDFYIDPVTNNILFQVPNTPENLKFYLEYKNAVKNDGVLKVDLVLYNNILRSVKFTTKKYRNNLS